MIEGQASEPVYQFGTFSLDPRQGTITDADRAVFLRPKAYALLLCLARNGGRVVPKSELMDAVWPETYVTEDSLTQNIREIRKGLGDADQNLVRTIARRGYMLKVSSGAEAPAPSPQPSVAVLRFRNENNDPAEESLVDGFAEDIINGLARFGLVTVLARNSSFAFSAHAGTDWSAVSNRIGADYLVGGSVRRSGNRASISINLIDAARSAQLWGERYEAVDVGLFSVQQDIGVQIVTRLVAHLDKAAARKSVVKPADDLAAYELVMRGLQVMRGSSHADMERAQRLFQRAIDRDPDYGLAYGYLALLKIVVSGLAQGEANVYEDALALAVRGVGLAPEQGMGYRAMALAQLGLRQHAAAEASMGRALEINRYDADGVAQMGYLQTLRGRPLDALTWLDRAFRLNPISPHWYYHDRAFALYQLGEYRDAASALEASPTLPPWIRTRLAASYAMLGDLDAARRNAAMIGSEAQFSPRDYVAGLPFEHAGDREHFDEGVEAALALLQRSP